MTASQTPPPVTVREVWDFAQGLGDPNPNEAIVVIKISRIDNEVSMKAAGDIGLGIFGALHAAGELSQEARAPELAARLRLMAAVAMKNYLAQLARADRP